MLPTVIAGINTLGHCGFAGCGERLGAEVSLSCLRTATTRAGPDLPVGQLVGAGSFLPALGVIKCESPALLLAADANRGEFQAVGFGGEGDGARLAGLGADDDQREAVVGVALRRLE